MEAPKPLLKTITGDIIKYDEYNIRDYYIKLFYNDVDELNIICYNLVLLDGIKYGLKMNLQDIYDLSNIFRQYTNMKDLYQFIIDLINEEKYELIKDNKNLALKLVISDIKKNEHKISFILVQENNNNTQEYINILSNEIKSMRIINDKVNTEIKQLKEEKKNY